MSSIWTPGGEHQVPREQPGPGADPPRSQDPASGGSSMGPAAGPGQAGAPAGTPTEEELAEHLQALQDQLLRTPAAVVVANHAFGLFELAALHLGTEPPQLAEAQLAIDALGALVEGLRGRLGEQEAQLAEGLTQLRLAYVQIRAAGDAT